MFPIYRPGNCYLGLICHISFTKIKKMLTLFLSGKRAQLYKVSDILEFHGATPKKRNGASTHVQVQN